MNNEEGYFGERVAATYDETSGKMFDPAIIGPTVDFLAELAGDGRALELGIGTGRVALPLAARGIEVHGIDLSRAMTHRLQAKPGHERQPAAHLSLGETGRLTCARINRRHAGASRPPRAPCLV